MNLPQKLSALMSGFHTAASRSAELMAPRWSGCIICGSPSIGAPHIYYSQPAYKRLRSALCEACFSAIPWLDSPECLLCGRGVRCEDCLRRPHRPFQYNRSAVSYTPVMREWLAAYKYRGNERLSPLLAEMLVPTMLRMTDELKLGRSKEDMIEVMQGGWFGRLFEKWINKWRNRNFSAIPGCWDAITYVPISDERAEERGFNQAEQLAAHLSLRFGIPLYGLLTRERHTEKLSFKTRAERVRDAVTLFAVNKDQLRALEQNASPLPSCGAHSSTFQTNLRILLIDDIYTTGSTAEACSAEMLRHTLRATDIYVLTWARS